MSSPHPAAIVFSPLLCRLYVIRDDDFAGDHALNTLQELARVTRLEPVALSPCLVDSNDALPHLGFAGLQADLYSQPFSQDASQCLEGIIILRK